MAKDDPPPTYDAPSSRPVPGPPNASSSRAEVPTAQLAIELAARASRVAVSVAGIVGKTVHSAVGTSRKQQNQNQNQNQLYDHGNQQQYQQQQYVQPPQQYVQPQPVIYTQPSPPRRYTYWSPVSDPACWSALFFYLTINLIFSLAAFIWVLVTMVVSVALLVLFPIGYPLLVGSALTWRLLGRMEGQMLAACGPLDDRYESRANPLVIMPTSPLDLDLFQRTQILVWNWKTWKTCGYFIFYKFWSSLTNFIIAIVAVVLGIPFFWCLPIMLRYLKGAFDGEVKYAARNF